MPKAGIVITGIKDVDKRLKRLEPKIQKKVIRQAMRGGLKTLAALLRSEAPVDTGATKAGIKVRAVKSRRRGTIAMEVRIQESPETKRTSGKTGETVWYPAILEHLTHWMARVFDNHGERVRQETLDRLRKGIEDEAGR